MLHAKTEKMNTKDVQDAGEDEDKMRIRKSTLKKIISETMSRGMKYSSQTQPWNPGSEYMPPRDQWAEYDFDDSYPIVQAVNALGVNVRTGDEVSVLDTEGDDSIAYEAIADMKHPVIQRVSPQIALVQLPDGVEAVMLNDRGMGMIVVRSADVGK